MTSSTPPPWRAPYRIETPRLNLSALGPEHVNQLHEVIPRNKAHLAAAMPWAHTEPLSYEDRIELLRQRRANFDLNLDFAFGIFERSTNRYIGGTGLHPRIGPQALEIGYWIAAERQGNGLVTETVTALVSVAFETMGARRIEIRCSPQNSRSRAIPERLGFHLDGILREGGLSGTGELEDKMVWSLLASEYPQHPLFAAPRPKLFNVLDEDASKARAGLRQRALVTIVPRGLDDPRVRDLLEHHVRTARGATALGSAHALDLEALKSPDIAFWSGWHGTSLVGVGALKQLSASHGEIKSMHTAQASRGLGVGTAMLRHIIDAARAKGMTRLSLETGSWAYFDPARALYRNQGFVECPPFGQYVEDPNSIFMTLVLPPSDADSRPT